MRCVLFVSTLSVLLTTVCLGEEPTTRASSVDRYVPKLHEFVRLIEDIEAANAVVREREWQEVFCDTFDDGNVSRARLVKPEAVGQEQEALTRKMVRADRIGDRRVLRFDATEVEAALLAMGPKVKGDFAVELVGSPIAERLCDLSIVCDDIGTGPSFQFGGYDNTRNLLGLGPNETDGQTEPARVDIAREPLLERGKWYRVRLEVLDGKVRGLVDGQLIGQAGVGNRFAPTSPRQPMLYVYNSEVLIDEFRVLSRNRIKPATAPTTTRPGDLEQALLQLAGFLDDDDFRVREQSMELLRRVGDAAVPVLRSMKAKGSPEMQQRVQELLRVLDPGNLD
jgi:hypothetical protein